MVYYSSNRCYGDNFVTAVLQVLVASAKGVMTVDPKQVPNLSSGVYIMSNKSGIVKVDNDNTLNTLQKSVRSLN